MSPEAPPDFPTLSEVVAEAAPTDPWAAPVVAVVEDPPTCVGLLPDGSVTVSVGDGRPRSDDPARPATLGDLARSIRSVDGDVLLISDPALLAEVSLAGLAAALATDSACTSVSAVPGVRAVVPGLPPPAIDVPVAGAVLVRRQDVLLAIDEADLADGSGSAPDAPAPSSLLEQVLHVVDRPGFVHRAYGAAADPTRPSPRPSRPTPRSAPRILVDGTFLAHALAGTQVQALALVRALARAGADVSVLRPSELHPTVAAAIDAAPDGVTLIDRSDAGRPDVFHRMSQIFSLHELADRLVIGERFVLTHQDMIWDRTAAYHAGDARRDYRRATAASLALADHVGFFSLHAARDAASDGGLDLDRATVVPLGVDHLAGRPPPAARADPLGGKPYLLMVGSSFRHKNRLFSLRVLRALVDRGWDGGLAFVGGESTTGSSTPMEEAFLRANPVLSGRVRTLGHLAESEQLALYRDAALVLFPSLYEGFGFIPFEAAALGTASVYTLRSSMGELLPPDGALPSLDAPDAAERVIQLLENPAERSAIVAAITARGASLTWDRTAAGYLRVYERALARPQRPTVAVLRAARELAERGAPDAHELRLLDIYRRRRGARLVVDATFEAGLAARRGLRALRRG